MRLGIWCKSQPHPIELRSFSFREPQRGREMGKTIADIV
jgi:hypothetical protein